MTSARFVKPRSSMSCAAMTRSGCTVSVSLRLMREPVTTISVKSAALASGWSGGGVCADAVATAAPNTTATHPRLNCTRRSAMTPLIGIELPWIFLRWIRATAMTCWQNLAPDSIYIINHLNSTNADLPWEAAMTTDVRSELSSEVDNLLGRLGVPADRYHRGTLIARTPITGDILGRIAETNAADARRAIEAAHAAFLQWRLVPPPRRGELVRLLGMELREHKEALGRLVSIEVGKVLSEGLGEVQEMIDICDFAVGLSRQLHGLTIATERPDHRMMETWHPLGVTGIISAFNFPVAVYAWNAALALVCGNSVVWKPSEKTSLTALATQALLQRASRRFSAQGGDAPEGLAGLIIGGRDAG